ncbi:MAG: aconitase X swivel domain-containing protein [Acidimicrobiia bacterium]
MTERVAELRLSEPLSFWGGIDPESGRIIDASHPQVGESISGKILRMPHSRGSSSSPSVLAEALRLGTGPVAIVLDQPDPMVVLGVLVARLLYGIECRVTVEPSID